MEVFWENNIILLIIIINSVFLDKRLTYSIGANIINSVWVKLFRRIASVLKIVFLKQNLSIKISNFALKSF